MHHLTVHATVFLIRCMQWHLYLITRIELLIHVGLETVSLKGVPFTTHVENGQHFKKGDLLLEFDIEAILKAGCEIQTPVIVANADKYEHLTVEKDRIVIEKVKKIRSKKISYGEEQQRQISVKVHGM